MLLHMLCCPPPCRIAHLFHPPPPAHFPALPPSSPLQRIKVSATKGNSSTYALGNTWAFDKHEKSPPTCEESAELVKNMVEGKATVEWTNNFQGFRAGKPIKKGDKVTVLDRLASKKVNNIKKQVIATKACEKILDEITTLTHQEETRDARVAAAEEAREAADDSVATEEATKNFAPFAVADNKDISAKGMKLKGAKGGVAKGTAAN